MKIKGKQIKITEDFDIENNKLINVDDPINNQDAATKAYVDSLLQGLSPKDSVKFASDATNIIDISTGGLSVTLDGAVRTLTAGDRILLKNQTNEEENGIYNANTGTWTRSSDADSWELLVSAFVFIEEGSINHDSGWTCTIDSGGTIDVDDIVWTKFSTYGAYTTDGEGLSLNTNIFSLEIDGSSLSKSAAGIKAATHIEESFTSLTATTASPSVIHNTGVIITNTPAGKCDITVQINGVTNLISYIDTSKAFFFSDDSGATALAQDDIIAASELYFNPIAAGFDLESDDSIMLIYSHIW